MLSDSKTKGHLCVGRFNKKFWKKAKEIKFYWIWWISIANLIDSMFNQSLDRTNLEQDSLYERKEVLWNFRHIQEEFHENISISSETNQKPL